MSYFIQPVITNFGAKTIAEAIAKKKAITFTRFALGNGAIKTNIENATNIANLVYTLSATQSYSLENADVVRIFGRLDNTEIKTELNITEIGIFAQIEGGSEFLYMYTWAENGDLIPSGDTAKIYRDYDFATTISNDSNVVIKFENEGAIFVTKEELDAFGDLKADKIDAQMFKLTEDNGGVKILNSTDLNTLFKAGFYYGGYLRNNPFGNGYAYVFVEDRGNGKACKQTLTDIYTSRTAIRTKSSKGWSDWQELATVEDLGVKADKTVAQMFKLTEDSGNAIVLVNKDLNELKEPGFYFLGDPKNAPGNLKYCFVTVVKNDNEVIQNVTGTITGRQFWRILSPNVSKKWYESATKEDVETQYLESVNCNSLNEQRMYYIINATNCFTNGYVYLFNGYCKQTSVAFQYGFDVINNRFGFRTYLQGVWKAWKVW